MRVKKFFCFFKFITAWERGDGAGAEQKSSNCAPALCHFFASVAMGLKVAAVMDCRRTDRVVREKLTRLEEFVSPMVKPEEDLKPIVQVYEVYPVRKAGAGNEVQWRVILSDGMYYQEGVLAPELIGERNVIKKGSIVRILDFELYACSHHELVKKRIVKVSCLEVLVADYRVIGDPCRLNWEEVKEDDWEEEDWMWLDPEEQEYEEEDEPCGFRDITETITLNAVEAINTNDNANLQPIILQIVDIRLISSPQMERYRLVLSDGTHLQQAMLATELNDKIKSNLAIKGSIIFLLEYLCTTVHNRRIVIVLDMDILKRRAEIIGNPKVYPSG
ncbi:hypothetical protein M758_1G128500 [Ceratodon purpureus]|nr:hypothetical protein M758_1G128500 [Ceratodon purpureus]